MTFHQVYFSQKVCFTFLADNGKPFWSFIHNISAIPFDPFVKLTTGNNFDVSSSVLQPKLLLRLPKPFWPFIQYTLAISFDLCAWLTIENHFDLTSSILQLFHLIHLPNWQQETILTVHSVYMSQKVCFVCLVDNGKPFWPFIQYTLVFLFYPCAWLTLENHFDLSSDIIQQLHMIHLSSWQQETILTHFIKYTLAIPLDPCARLTTGNHFDL